MDKIYYLDFEFFSNLYNGGYVPKFIYVFEHDDLYVNNLNRDRL